MRIASSRGAMRGTSARALLGVCAIGLVAGMYASAADAAGTLSPAQARVQAQQAYEAGLDARARADTQAAALHFEQAALLDPDFAGAWYDYGLALCELGDPVGCRNILSAALEQFGPPPGVATLTPRALRAHAGELRVGVGASTNLSRSTAAEDLTLLLDGVPIVAHLDARYRERGGAYAEAGFTWETRWPMQDISLRMELNARRPFSRELPDFHAGLAEVGIGVAPRSRVGLIALGVDEDYLGAIRSVGAWAEHRFSPQGMALRATLERREPSGQPGWWTTRLLSSLPLGEATVLNAGLEYDFAQEQRAGRAQYRASLDLRQGYTLPQVGRYVPRLVLGAGVLHARDTDPYSPLFGDVRNHRTRWQLSSDLSVNLNRQWRVNLGLYAARQSSAIDLLDYKEATATLSVTYVFQ
ncbi:tetratricopeptide repeat protein [Verticiella sediminum]|uniref:tetratricopeptide repeat protein n=1 Tax=Verticiella sediminum TaxID=1247510 RepID=UPI00147929BA|nr:tetratricopeptide repeat protein [Verticiella sediminum]